MDDLGNITVEDVEKIIAHYDTLKTVRQKFTYLKSLHNKELIAISNHPNGQQISKESPELREKMDAAVEALRNAYGPIYDIEIGDKNELTHKLKALTREIDPSAKFDDDKLNALRAA